MHAANIPDLIIIGAGPIGLSCGIFALNAGLDTHIITLDEPNQRTAGIAAGGMLAPAYEAFADGSTDEINFALEARNQWNEFAQTLAIKIDAKALAIAKGEIELICLEKMAAMARENGLVFAINKAPDFIKGDYALDMVCDALINPNLAIEKMRAQFLSLGGIIIEDEILNLEIDSVIGNKNNYKAKKFLIANGFSAHDFSKKISELKALIPARGQTMAINIKPNFIGSIRHKSTYLMARGDNIVIGATQDRGNSNWNEIESDKNILLENAIALMPSLQNAQIIKNFSGVRPATIDDMPIIGKSQFGQFYLAIGAYRNGWAYAPLMAKMAINCICENILPPISVSPLRLK